MVPYKYVLAPSFFRTGWCHMALVLSGPSRGKLLISLFLSQRPHRNHIPQKASAVVFSVPCPLEGGHRPDVSKVDGGILLMDTSSYTPRTQHCLLPYDQVRTTVSRCCCCSSSPTHVQGVVRCRWITWTPASPPAQLILGGCCYHFISLLGVCPHNTIYDTTFYAAVIFLWSKPPTPHRVFPICVGIWVFLGLLGPSSGWCACPLSIRCTLVKPAPWFIT